MLSIKFRVLYNPGGYNGFHILTYCQKIVFLFLSFLFSYIDRYGETTLSPEDLSGRGFQHSRMSMSEEWRKRKRTWRWVVGEGKGRVMGIGGHVCPISHPRYRLTPLPESRLIDRLSKPSHLHETGTTLNFEPTCYTHTDTKALLKISPGENLCVFSLQNCKSDERSDRKIKQLRE